MYLRQEVEVWEREPKVTIRPAGGGGGGLGGVTL